MMLRSNKRRFHNKLALEQHYYRNTQYPTSQDSTNSLRPLKVWQGYRGNVYFEPLRIVKVPAESTIETLYKISYKRTYAVDERLLAGWAKQWCTGNEPSHRYNVSSSQPVGKPSRVLGSMRQLSIEDKKITLSDNNGSLPEDLTWICGLESVGSLRTGNPTSKLKERDNCTRDKFRKGLTSRSFKNTTVLPVVNGSKYFACDPCILQSRLV
ncbi:uncharacterized protein [Scyliorhinus torazame]